jgi:hypothetical protein
MKAEHRHQLQTNVLADSMGRLLQGMKSGPSKSSALLWVFFGLVLVVLVGWQVASWSRGDTSALWVAVDEDIKTYDTNPAKLDEFGQQNKGTIAGRTARFEAARKYFQYGQANLGSFDRASAIEKMKQARTVYAELAKECADSPLLAREALLMIAAVDESLVGTTTPDDLKAELDQAVESYEKVAREYPQGVLGEKAKTRAQELRDSAEQAEKFYRELSQLAAPRMQLSPEPKPEVKPEAKPEAKPEQKDAAKTESTPAPKDATKPESTPAPKDATKPESTPPPKTETKSDNKSETKKDSEKK